MDGLPEHAHDEVSIKNVLICVDVTESYVGVVFAVVSVPVLLDLDVCGTGWDSDNRIVPVFGAIEKATRLVTGRVVTATNTTPVQFDT